MTAHIYVDRIEGMDALVARLQEHPAVARRVMLNVLKQLANHIRGIAMKNMGPHRKTGLTQMSVQTKLDVAALTARIGPHNMVGLFLEKGTHAHAIAARNAAALMLPVGKTGGFVRAPGTGSKRRSVYQHYRATGALKSGSGAVGAQVAFFKSVHHPGQRPYPWLFPALGMAAPFRSEVLRAAGLQITHFLATGEVAA